MSLYTKTGTRHKISALIASLFMPGLGQIYNGAVFKGVCIFMLFLFLLPAGLMLAVKLPDNLLYTGVMITAVAALLVYVLASVDAWRTAEHLGEGYILKPFNCWYFYVMVWIVGTIIIRTVVFSFTQASIMQACHIPSGSMEPVILPGDYVIVDKSSRDRISPHRNDIVIFVYPDDRSKIYIKRIVGLPGDTLRIDTAHTVVVPHGYVYVMGDNRNHAIDSRTFGPVPLCDVLGKARQIYFSVGPQGVRWNRIGKTL